AIHCGDSRELLRRVEPGSVDLSIWSPPYFVGKSYERDLAFDDWTDLLRDVIAAHAELLVPGGFAAVDIARHLCFAPGSLPRLQADVVSSKRSPVTREMVVTARDANPALNRYELAALLGCSEQTIDRRLNHNNIRGGKYAEQTRVKTVAGLVEAWAEDA